MLPICIIYVHKSTYCTAVWSSVPVFKLSMEFQRVLMPGKMSCVVPVLKKTLLGYSQQLPTSGSYLYIMKTLERLILNHLCCIRHIPTWM